MIRFAQPWFLLALCVIPIFIWWYWVRGRTLEGTFRISSATLFQDHFIRRGERKNLFLKVLNIITVFFIIIGLARPQLVDTLQKRKVDVVDIVMVIDISSSMLADDFKPNRLEVVKRTAKEFIKKRAGDRIGLLVFAAETFIQCPLTVDQDVLLSLLDDIEVVPREYDGTAIGMAIANGVNRLRHSSAKSKVMILLSDGSNNAGELDPLTAADIASELGVKIYTIGAGTNQAVTLIPNVGYIRNEIDEQTLQAIAQKTGGQYFRATDEAMLAEVYQQIDALERTTIEVKDYTQYREPFGWFLIPAVLVGTGKEILARFMFRKQT
jgi:Ca-activated chloride channel family protein